MKVAEEEGGHGPSTRQQALVCGLLGHWGKPVRSRLGSRPQQLPLQPDESTCCPRTIKPPPSLCPPFLLKASPSCQLSRVRGSSLRFLMTRPVSYLSLPVLPPEWALP